MEPNKDTEAAGSFPSSFPSQRCLRMAPPHNDTIPDRFRSLQDTAFLPLLWRVRTGVWRGQYSWKCQLSMVPLFITLAAVTTEPTIGGPARLSPVKTAVALTTGEQELALFLSWHYSPSDLPGLRFTLAARHAQITVGKGCPLQLYKTASFPREQDENLIDHPVKQLAFSHSECSGTWTWPETQQSIRHTSAFHAILFVLTSTPNAWY